MNVKEFRKEASGQIKLLKSGHFKLSICGLFKFSLTLNRLTGITYTGGGSVSYTYDAVGNRLTMVDGTGTTAYMYDVLNRPLSITSPQGTVSYTYDAKNRLTLTTPAGTVTYTYDAADRMLTVTDWASRTTSYTYDAVGRQTGISYPNAVSTTNTYDSADRLTSITTSFSGTTLASFSYTLDAVGNRLTMVDPDGTTTYTYDALNRLLSVAYPSGSPAAVSYTYDPMGNRLIKVEDGVVTSYSYDTADRLLSTTTGATATTFTWDNNGNMLSKGSQTFTWDTTNRMMGLTNGATTASYQYNGDGVRVGRTVNGATTSYLQDMAGGLPVVLRESTGGVSTDYVYGSDLVESVNGGTPSFYHTDGLGSTRLLTDNAGLITDQYSFDAFGGTRIHSGLSEQPFTFTGEQFDSENQLFFLRSRYYDYNSGRFLQIDNINGSVLYPQTWNKFIYVFNNPIHLIDPMGFWGISSRTNIGYTFALLAGIDVSGGYGPELVFPSWNPLDWRFGFGVGGEGKVSVGPQGEGSGFVSGSIYIWDKKTPIPILSNAPVTTCIGGTISGVAGGGLGLSRSKCTGQGKTGEKVSVSVKAGAGGGISGFVSEGTGKSWTWSLKDIWNGSVQLYNALFGGGNDIVNQNISVSFGNDYYSGGGYGGGGGTSWGGPPSQGK